MSKQFEVRAVDRAALASVAFSVAIDHLKKMRDAKYKDVNSDFVAQIEPQKTGTLDMTNLRASDRTHQTIVKTIRNMERMQELAQAIEAASPEGIVKAAIEATEKAAEAVETPAVA